MQYIFQQDKTKRSVKFAIVVPYGSANDADDHGIAHLAEHLCFFSPSDPKYATTAAELEKLGVAIRGETYKTDMVFSFVCRPQVYPRAVEILKTMLARTDYTDSDLEREKRVVLAEIADKCSSTEQTVAQTLCSNKSFCHEILGSEQTLSQITVEKIQRVKELMSELDSTVLVCGNVSDQVLSLTKQLFGDGKRRVDVPNVVNSTHCEPISFVNDGYDDCEICYAFKPEFSSDRVKDILTLEVLANVLSCGDCAVLTADLRDKAGITYGVDGAVTVMPSEAIVTLRFTVARGDVLFGIKTAEKALSKPVTEECLQQTKAFLCDNVCILSDNLNDYVDRYTDNLITLKKDVSPEKQAQIIAAVTVADCNDMLARLLTRKYLFCYGQVDKATQKQIKKIVKS